MSKIPLSYYQRPDVVAISKDLLGKYLCTNIGGEGITSGIIVETEAYGGAVDKACHAYGGKLTGRTKVMYEGGGISYVYLIYGFYNLLNIVTNTPNIPEAVLIRAIEPADGIDIMLRRRKLDKVQPRLTAGPGVLTQALGITRDHNGIPMDSDILWLEDRGLHYPENEIIASPRVNVDYAEEDALLPWRFRVKDSKWTSKPK